MAYGDPTREMGPNPWTRNRGPDNWPEFLPGDTFGPEPSGLIYGIYSEAEWAALPIEEKMRIIAEQAMKPQYQQQRYGTPGGLEGVGPSREMSVDPQAYSMAMAMLEASNKEKKAKEELEIERIKTDALRPRGGGLMWLDSTKEKPSVITPREGFTDQEQSAMNPAYETNKLQSESYARAGEAGLKEQRIVALRSILQTSANAVEGLTKQMSDLQSKQMDNENAPAIEALTKQIDYYKTMGVRAENELMGLAGVSGLPDPGEDRGVAGFIEKYEKKPEPTPADGAQQDESPGVISSLFNKALETMKGSRATENNPYPDLPTVFVDDNGQRISRFGLPKEEQDRIIALWHSGALTPVTER